MSKIDKIKEIWQIIKRRDYKEGDEVHAVQFNGGLMVSNQLYESLEPKLEELPEKTSYLGDLYGLKIMSTPYLPYIYHEVKKQSAPPQPEEGEL